MLSNEATTAFANNPADHLKAALRLKSKAFAVDSRSVEVFSIVQNTDRVPNNSKLDAGATWGEMCTFVVIFGNDELPTPSNKDYF